VRTVARSTTAGSGTHLLDPPTATSGSECPEVHERRSPGVKNAAFATPSVWAAKKMMPEAPPASVRVLRLAALVKRQAT